MVQRQQAHQPNENPGYRNDRTAEGSGLLPRVANSRARGSNWGHYAPGAASILRNPVTEPSDCINVVSWANGSGQDRDCRAVNSSVVWYTRAIDPARYERVHDGRFD